MTSVISLLMCVGILNDLPGTGVHLMTNHISCSICGSTGEREEVVQCSGTI